MSAHISRPFTFAFELEDYREMFDLTDQDLEKAILDYPAGFSSFNAEMHRLGRTVISADPFYGLQPNDMLNRIDNQLVGLEEHFDEHKHTLEEDRTLNNLLNEARDASKLFFDDYLMGRQQERYQEARMPGLPYDDNEFELVISSHWLFSDHPDSYYQMQTVKEMLRVGGEVRIFPVLDHTGEVSPSLGPLMMQLQQEGIGVEVREVKFALQQQGNAMLRVWAKECKVS
ncbi:MAG: hypothetical protein P1U34_01460 [Coxiellaceae bacterium]|nr:hypothetical protein [Coxiellaceae bacterium]